MVRSCEQSQRDIGFLNPKPKQKMGAKISQKARKIENESHH